MRSKAEEEGGAGGRRSSVREVIREGRQSEAVRRTKCQIYTVSHAHTPTQSGERRGQTPGDAKLAFSLFYLPPETDVCTGFALIPITTYK